MSEKDFNQPPKDPEIDPESLAESELEEVAGGMQNQLDTNPVAEHPGGVNKTLDKNAAKVPIRCNWHK